MKVYMFPGQGSQKVGMGKDLFDRFPEMVKRADSILGYSVKQLCVEDPNDQLNSTEYTQPALFVVNALSYLAKIEDGESEPDFLLGHSLGEFNALHAAGCFDFDAALKIVRKRGELMSQAEGGAMAAILNVSAEEIINILKSNQLDSIDIANYNAPAQTVISGPVTDIKKAQSFFQEGNMLYIPLNTSGAFHSHLMAAAKDKFSKYLKRFKISEPRISVIANVSAKSHHADEIINNMSEHITSPVQWVKSIEYLVDVAGSVDRCGFEELGSGDTLSKLVFKITEAISKREKVKNHRDPAIDSVHHVRQPTLLTSGGAIHEQAESKDPKVKVSRWNELFPVGSKFKSLTTNYGDLETRSEAMLILNFRAVVFMKDYNGYFDLDEISPI